MCCVLFAFIGDFITNSRYNIKINKMKQIFLKLAVLSFVIFAIYSCGSKNSKENSDVKDKENTTVNDENIEVYDKLTKIELSISEREKLNTFFSNFAEVQMADFDEQSLTDADIIYFAVYHNSINDYERFESVDNNKIKIKKEFIDETAEKYFDRKIELHQSTESITFANGYYTIENASGEAFYFSQIEDIFDLGDNNCFVTVNLYVASSGWTGSSQANPETWDEEDAPEFYQKMKTNIRKKDGYYVISKYISSEE